MKQYFEHYYTEKRDEIWQNALELFENRKGIDDNTIINRQIKFINNSGITGKNKYKSVDYLKQYFNTCNNNHKIKGIAEQTFYNSVLCKIN
jgi:hypothetical protein